MRNTKFERDVGLTFLLLLSFGLWLNKDLGRLFGYERPDGGRGDDDDDDRPYTHFFDKGWFNYTDVTWKKGEQKRIRKEKRGKKEYSAQRKAWAETMQTWNDPTYEREHPHVEAVGHARMWDKRADEQNRARFMGHTRNPLPDEIHGMSNEEKIRLIDNELVHLRAAHAQTKDQIDQWVKNGSDPTVQLNSPQSQWWTDAGQVQFENHEILEEIARLEEQKRYLLTLPF